MLAGLARESSAIHRLQWVERGLPDNGAAVLNYLDEEMKQTPWSECVRSYSALLAEAKPVSKRHEVMLAISVRSRRRERSRPEAAADLESCTLLEQEVRSVSAQLASAELTVEGCLSPRSLCRAFRSAVEHRPAPAGERPPSPESPAAWPHAAEVSWSCYRTESTWHATYWIAEWPRVDVGPDFLGPLLLQVEARRTVSMTMEPVSPAKAAREAEQARTADTADSELRRRGGFMATARRRREEEGVVRREVELADGHAQFRFTGYVTVTSASEESLEKECTRVEQVAAQSRLELRRLYGQQDEAFTWTLPLGRGLA